MEGIGATPHGRRSNEAQLDGRRVVVKTASADTRHVHVTRPMRDRVAGIVAAFDQPDGSVEVKELKAKHFNKGHLAQNGQFVFTRRIFDLYGALVVVLVPRPEWWGEEPDWAPLAL